MDNLGPTFLTDSQLLGGGGGGGGHTPTPPNVRPWLHILLKTVCRPTTREATFLLKYILHSFHIMHGNIFRIFYAHFATTYWLEHFEPIQLYEEIHPQYYQFLQAFRRTLWSIIKSTAPTWKFLLGCKHFWRS